MEEKEEEKEEEEEARLDIKSNNPNLKGEEKLCFLASGPSRGGAPPAQTPPRASYF